MIIRQTVRLCINFYSTTALLESYERRSGGRKEPLTDGSRIDVLVYLFDIPSIALSSHRYPTIHPTYLVYQKEISRFYLLDGNTLLILSSGSKDFSLLFAHEKMVRIDRSNIFSFLNNLKSKKGGSTHV